MRLQSFWEEIQSVPSSILSMNYLLRDIRSNGYLNIGRSLVLHELSICSVRQKGAPLARLTAFILFLGSSESWLPLSRKKKVRP